MTDAPTSTPVDLTTTDGVPQAGWFRGLIKDASHRLTDRDWMRGFLAILLVLVYAMFGLIILLGKDPGTNVVIALVTGTSSLVTAAVAFFFGTRVHGNGG